MDSVDELKYWERFSIFLLLVHWRLGLAGLRLSKVSGRKFFSVILSTEVQGLGSRPLGGDSWYLPTGQQCSRKSRFALMPQLWEIGRLVKKTLSVFGKYYRPEIIIRNVSTEMKSPSLHGVLRIMGWQRASRTSIHVRQSRYDHHYRHQDQYGQADVGYRSCMSNEFSGSEIIINTRKFVKAQGINKNRIDA